MSYWMTFPLKLKYSMTNFNNDTLLVSQGVYFPSILREVKLDR